MFNKIGIFFGSFNPMHEGHIYAIKKALNTTIDKLYLVISPQCEKVPFIDRRKMAELTIRFYNLENKIDFFDENECSPYIYDVLKTLSSRFTNTDIVVFVGLDAFLTIDTWKEPKYILENHTIYIIPRNCTDATESIFNKKEELLKTITSNIKTISYSNPLKTFNMDGNQIRNLIDLGQSTENMIVSEVRKYIDDKSLYKISHKTLF